MTNNKPFTEDNLNRLAIAIISKYDCTYEEALERLESLKLSFECGEEIATSLPLQAALVTAVNTGVRCFLGGITVSMPDNTPCLLPCVGINTLNKVIVDLGAQISPECPHEQFKLMFGLPGDIENRSLQIVCNDWQGGISSGERIELPVGTDLPLGGIAAGAMGVGTAFLRLSGIHSFAGDSTTGISLWRPDLNWLVPEASGIKIERLPKQFWLLGLGHLGQAYLWNIALLPYPKASEVHFLLQDYDKISEANLSAGLLSTINDLGNFKTRACAEWLENRGFSTLITERKYDGQTICGEYEPRIALCGFDNAESRLTLENNGFDLVIEAALGGTLDLFDNIILHSFPNGFKKPTDIWKVKQAEEINNKLLKQFAHLKENGCGVLAQTLASKAISTSFVGAFAGSLVVAELLRASHGGTRYDIINSSIRAIEFSSAVANQIEKYKSQLAVNGFVDIRQTKEKPQLDSPTKR